MALPRRLLPLGTSVLPRNELFNAHSLVGSGSEHPPCIASPSAPAASVDEHFYPVSRLPHDSLARPSFACENEFFQPPFRNSPQNLKRRLEPPILLGALA